MTIDKAIAELELLKKNTFSYMSAHQAFITAIDTMRKYQKIKQIVETDLSFPGDVQLEEIFKVINDYESFLFDKEESHVDQT